MLSYQHLYHAGCIADVVKHLTLTRILQYLTTKEKPFFYLETHAGRGIYDLSQPQAQKTQEQQQGIQLVYPERAKLSAFFAPFFTAINTLNPEGKLRYYPGSAYFAISALREQDRAVLCELHPQEFQHLTRMLTLEKHVHCYQEEGLQQLIAHLPPKERRGLLFIDPSYEKKTDYNEIPQKIKEAYKRFATGIYCIWYPLVHGYRIEQLYKGLQRIATTPLLRIEFSMETEKTRGMKGAGLMVINPPYTLEQEMQQGLLSLRSIFVKNAFLYKIEKI